MPKRISLQGQRFGRLTVSQQAENLSPKQTAWRCICDCGIEAIIATTYLRTGATQSCGCLRSDNATLVGRAKRTHGRTKSAEYGSWRAMRDRCLNPECKDYPSWGGRGITICARWTDFELFFADMGEKPSGKHTIHRKDNDGDYEPGNCIWATPVIQGREKRNSRKLFYRGQQISMAELVEQTGLSRDMLFFRLRKGWTVEQAVATPPFDRKVRRYGRCEPVALEQG